MHTKLFAAFSAMLCLLMVPVIIVVAIQMRQSILDEFLKRGMSITRNLAAVTTEYVTSYNYLKIEQSIAHVFKENDVLYAAVLFFDGEPAAFVGSAELKETVMSGELGQKAFQSEVPLVQYGVDKIEEFCEVAVPILIDQQKWGTVRIGFPMRQMHIAVSETKKMLMIIAAIALTIASLFSQFLAKRIVRPISALVESVEAVSNGQYHRGIEVTSRDEIGYLADRFSGMRNTVKEHIDLLTQSNQDLATANDHLNHEIKERIKIENALRRRDAALKSINYSSERFLNEMNWQHCIHDVLTKLGEATDVTHLTISQNIIDDQESSVGACLYSWSRDIESQCLKTGDGEVIVDDVPIQVGHHLWGRLGFSRPASSAEASQVVAGALQNVARNLGIAIQKQHHMEILESASRAKDDFLANMSHELRTPLNHIIGFTELVMDEHFGEINDVQKEYLGDVLTSSNHLLSLINDILDLSKIEAGKIKLEPKDTDIETILVNSLTMVDHDANQKRIRLETDILSPLPIISADERKVKQILYNLLSNAVKFTYDGGTIRLTAREIDCTLRSGGRREDSKGRRYIASTGKAMSQPGLYDGKCIEISIEDDGIGIESSDLKRVFNRFDQVESASNRNFQGAGLGLSLTKSFVNLHGGIIRAESEGKGKGSRFVMFLPA